MGEEGGRSLGGQTITSTAAALYAPKRDEDYRRGLYLVRNLPLFWALPQMARLNWSLLQLSVIDRGEAQGCRDCREDSATVALRLSVAVVLKVKGSGNG